MLFGFALPCSFAFPCVKVFSEISEVSNPAIVSLSLATLPFFFTRNS